jgi:mRNA interferase MazF
MQRLGIAALEVKNRHTLALSPSEFNRPTGVVTGLPMTMAAYNATNPFAIRVEGPKGQVSFIFAHQPKSFDWRARNAKPHPWRQIPEIAFSMACETLNQIIDVSP